MEEAYQEPIISRVQEKYNLMVNLLKLGGSVEWGEGVSPVP
jgi:hypothetical protein